MLFCLFIAILSTLIWINVSVAQSVEAKVNPYSQDTDGERKRSILKNYLVIIMSIFWAIVIRFGVWNITL